MTAPPVASPNPARGPAHDDATSICVGCALCCNGALFARAKVKNDEEDRRLGTLDFSLFNLDGKRHFRQPCSYEKSCSCSIYQTRPDVCRAFRCKLLKQHDAGKIDSADAREKIAKAKNLRAAVAALDPEAANDGPRQDIWRALAQQFPGLTGAERQLAAKRILSIAALETYLDRWFRKKKQAEPDED